MDQKPVLDVPVASKSDSDILPVGFLVHLEREADVCMVYVSVRFVMDAICRQGDARFRLETEANSHRIDAGVHLKSDAYFRIPEGSKAVF